MSIPEMSGLVWNNNLLKRDRIHFTKQLSNSLRIQFPISLTTRKTDCSWNTQHLLTWAYICLCAQKENYFRLGLSSWYILNNSISVINDQYFIFGMISMYLCDISSVAIVFWVMCLANVLLDQNKWTIYPNLMLIILLLRCWT